MSTIKILVTLQCLRDNSGYEDTYGKADNFILALPTNQAYLADYVNDIFNATAKMFAPAIQCYSYGTDAEIATLMLMKQRWSLAKSSMENSPGAKLINEMGWDEVKSVALHIMRNNIKNLTTIVCLLFNWRLITKLPCVIAKITNITLDTYIY